MPSAEGWEGLSGGLVVNDSGYELRFRHAATPDVVLAALPHGSEHTVAYWRCTAESAGEAVLRLQVMANVPGYADVWSLPGPGGVVFPVT